MKNIAIVLIACVISVWSFSAYAQQIVIYNNYGYGGAPSIQYYTPSVWVPYAPSPQPYVIYYPVVPAYRSNPVIPAATMSWQPAIYQWNNNVYYRRDCFGNYYYYYYR